ncbi:MAG: large conductance mechanosensitive channel protein MscL [Chitinophagaceae bacterium]|nr:large conductance mechanosensitive channel protein MscL [Chitinophagaceae bacterium]
MGFIKEFKEFALKGNLVDIAVAFVMGGAFGKVVSTFTEKIIAPIIGMLTGGQNFNDKKVVLKHAIEEVKDPTGKIIIPAGAEVDLEWGYFVTALIDFAIVAFVMFLIIKAINSLKKKDVVIQASVSKTEELLTEIRDSLKK